ncbi:MAG: glycosyltransferase family 39 protein [Candidatus Omnitrophica bacterium]|nr:glycosyltransferase family 39 protein [Candidatus Omnitrophota bacterium]MDD5653822.1 glycosyltransferase family 39 protein [Candidatus Omnitrophota bacterium]
MPIIIWLFHLINNFIWLKLDTLPLLWDAGSYYLDSLVLSDLLRNFSYFNFTQAIHVGGQYPPFVPLLAALAYPIFGKSQDVAVFLVNGIFLGVLIFSVYSITRNIADKKSACFAAFLVTMYPIVFGHSRVLMYDLPVAAVVCLSVSLFAKSGNLENRGYALLWGVVCGIGLLTKFSFLLFAASAHAYLFYKNFPKKKNFSIAVLIAVLIASVWYIPNFSRFLYAIFVYPQTARAVTPQTFSLASLFYYFFALINYQVSFSLFAAFVIGLFFFLRQEREKRLFLIFWILFAYLGCTLTNYKSPRYTIPLLPAVAMISAIGIMSIHKRMIRVAVVAIVAAVAGIQFFSYSYGIKILPPFVAVDLPASLATKLRVKSIILFDRKGGENPLEQHTVFKREDWKAQEVLDSIINSSGDLKKKAINVFIIPDDPRIHAPLIALAYSRQVAATFTVASAEEMARAERDYVIIKDSKWMSPPYFSDFIKRSQDFFKANIDNFALIKKIILPDDSLLLIYKRR